MSGPVDPDDVPAERLPPGGADARVEVTPSRTAEVGGLPVRRALPRRRRRTVGAWCFVDHLGPAELDERRAVDVAPHPHTGLATVTWLLQGAQVHRDSLGTEQLIRPGEVNLMTAGRGVAHSEESLDYRGPLHGVQLWVAQPEATRHGEAVFEHHAELPQVDLPSAVATVLVGALADAESKARHDTPLVGLDLALRPGRTALPVEASFEHAVVVLDGAVGVGGEVLRPGVLAYLGEGRDEVVLESADASRVLLLGGEPFPEPVVMWWNFVARTRDELVAAYADWEAEDARFGRVVASGLPRTVAPAPPWPATRP